MTTWTQRARSLFIRQMDCQRVLCLTLAILMLAPACASEEEGYADEAGGNFALPPENEELGKAIFLPTGEGEGKADSFQGKRGISVDFDQSETAVWEVENLWHEHESPAARAAGIVWGPDSGLDWDEKYALWVESMEASEGFERGKTFTLTTPHGKSLPAPVLECAEASLFLRAAFASWYKLPFFVEARDRQGERLYLGHFGFRTESKRYASSARFSRYADYRGRFSTPEEALASWPSDAKLRGRGLGGSQDDGQPFLFEGARAGAYFDEIFLNKRTGYFMVYLLSYFGSMNLADSANTFNLKPEATRPGDTLLHRWQRRGIGHTMVVKQVQRADEGMSVELVSGSMPRRQPAWDSASASQYSLTAQKGGGLEESRDGVSYARLGGGMKRWRTAAPINGSWTNIVPKSDRDLFISSGDTDAIGERVKRFEELLEALSPERLREAIVGRIHDAREHLRRYPASCAARIRREEAFEELYTLEAENFYSSREEVDGTYRRLDDFVFAALVYEESKTCCWNQSTEAMYEIIMDYATKEQAHAEADDLCVTPTVFRAIDGGYTLWATHAENLGRGAEWAAWSEDELCEQRAQTTDPLLKADEAAEFCAWAGLGD
ncbi:MAG: hypothetical protein VYD19_05060 [Myxococcota bacterium]|nr:hypothetical protein [Myxococcota bacterium]